MKKIIASVLLLLCLLIAGVLAWMSVPFAYQKELTAAALHSDSEVQVQTSPWLSFTPAKGPISDGIVFYPGGKTAPATFAPVMRQLAAEGHLVVIVPMPFNTAFLGIDKANAVMAAYPDIERWHLIGHSLGGVAAAEYAKKQPERLASLIFWASYPASDLQAFSLPTLSVAGTLDSQTTPEKIAANAEKFPARTQFIEMPAANHWQYGYFADSRNTEANLRSRQSQIDELLAHSLAFIRLQAPGAAGQQNEDNDNDA
ncbi:alpha/beta hydrolase [Alkalimonas sp. MEB108]|uniref:Alpha/beta hydrolase n=1 Tax=Alkalimonas cellulosilytica TaxID=3058395 RepID=A0ABU7JAR1_9GAMM|nr:alpha/beta hydrolase [Alkalimonas sp. MEB108]MEE2003082.1 alpha/beta hydrolase [Alkalimonas sp. MEB108]